MFNIQKENQFQGKYTFDYMITQQRLQLQSRTMLQCCEKVFAQFLIFSIFHNELFQII